MSAAFGIRADNDAIRLHEVGYGIAFLEKFRVGNDVKGNGRAPFGKGFRNDGAHAIRRADRDGGLVHHNKRTLHVPADIARHGLDMGQVAGAVRPGRRAHGDEHELRVPQAGGNIRGKDKTARGMVAPRQILKPRLEDVNPPAFQQRDHIGVDVHATGLVPHFRKTGRAHQPHIACTHNTQTHASLRITPTAP